jgi:lipoprotein-anchoring transpeptidase ErfK/SrfK
MDVISKRFFLIGGAATSLAFLSGCGGSSPLPNVADLVADRGTSSDRSGATISRPNYAEVYGSYSGEQFPVTSFNYKSVDPTFLRQLVAYKGNEAPGTLVVDPHARQLFLVEEPGRATRYGVGVGREGFLWKGNAQINMRRAWPDWIPPSEMIERDTTVRAQLQTTPRGLGVRGGPQSPLGARAMYLYSNGDTGYRIHGTTEPETIGTHVSSGCIRMVNQDIIHIYSRTREGAPVIVLA